MTRITLVGVNVLPEIGVACKRAAANFPFGNNQPPRFIRLPGGVIEPVFWIFVKGFVIEENEASNFFRCYGAAELDVHSLDRNLATCGSSAQRWFV